MGPILPLLFLKCYTWSLTHPLKWLLSLPIVIWFVPLSSSCIFCRWAPSCHQTAVPFSFSISLKCSWAQTFAGQVTSHSCRACSALITWTYCLKPVSSTLSQLCWEVTHHAHLEIRGQDTDAILLDLQWQHGVGFSQSRGLGETSILYCCLLNCIKPTWI